MRMELIQPFINAADAVLATCLQCETRMGDVSMEEDTYRRKGVAAIVHVHGDYGIQPHPSRRGVDGHHHAADGGHRGG